MSRFDYVKYDELAAKTQDAFKQEMNCIGDMIDKLLTSPRAKALAITNLEQVYMWIGKAIRDDQITRNGSAPLQEERRDDFDKEMNRTARPSEGTNG